MNNALESLDYPGLLARVERGEGVEAILADMGVNSTVACQWLRKHPTAKADIADAKMQTDAVAKRDAAQAEFKARHQP